MANIKQVLEELGKLDSKDQAKVLATLTNGKSPGDVVPKEFEAYWQKIDQPTLLAAFQTPEGKENIAQMVRDRSGDRFVKRYKPALNLILQGADIMTSLGQINQSNKALSALQQPAIPQSPGVDPALNNQIYQAQQGTFDQSRALAPAKQAINDAYAAQENVNRQISGGQAGAYGSRMQAAYNDRMRASLALPKIADDVKAREQQRLDNLISTRGQLAQQDYSNRLAGTNMALDQYNRNMLAAAQLGSAGRANLRNVFQTLPENITRFAGQVTANPASDPYTYGQQVEMSLANKLANMPKVPLLPINSGMNFAPDLSGPRQDFLNRKRYSKFMNHPAYNNFSGF